MIGTNRDLDLGLSTVKMEVARLRMGKSQGWEKWLCESGLLCALPAWPFVHADVGRPKLCSVTFILF